jgi:hypothetical protein
MVRASALKLVVERAMFVQDAVKDIRCDPSRRESGHFGWQCKSLSRHWGGNIPKTVIGSSME